MHALPAPIACDQHHSTFASNIAGWIWTSGVADCCTGHSDQATFSGGDQWRHDSTAANSTGDHISSVSRLRIVQAAARRSGHIQGLYPGDCKFHCPVVLRLFPSRQSPVECRLAQRVAKLGPAIRQQRVTVGAESSFDQGSCMNGPFRLSFIPSWSCGAYAAKCAVQHLAGHLVGICPSPPLAAEVCPDTSTQRPLQPEQRGCRPSLESQPDHRDEFFHKQIEPPLAEAAAPGFPFSPIEDALVRLHPNIASSNAALRGVCDTGAKACTPSGRLAAA